MQAPPGREAYTKNTLDCKQKVLFTLCVCLCLERLGAGPAVHMLAHTYLSCTSTSTCTVLYSTVLYVYTQCLRGLGAGPAVHICRTCACTHVHVLHIYMYSMYSIVQYSTVCTLMLTWAGSRASCSASRLSRTAESPSLPQGCKRMMGARLTPQQASMNWIGAFEMSGSLDPGQGLQKRAEQENSRDTGTVLTHY